jgi:hypothetical protein
MSQQHQPKLHYETIDDALHDAVQVLGGFKKIGPRLWPEFPVDEAAHKLRHCLNRARREKLSPEQVLLLLRWARDADFHGAKHYLDDETGYDRSKAISPEDAKAKLQREFIDTVGRLESIKDQLGRIGSPG